MRAYPMLFLALVGVASCGGQSSSGDAADVSAAAPVIHEAHFIATDFAFEGPDVLEAGMVTFVLTNEGDTWHHLQLVRLPEGMSFEQFQEGMSEMQPGSPPPPWWQDAGGVNPPAPDQPARVTQLLEAGEYAVLCLVDTPDRVPHVMKGMMRPLTVTAATQPVPALPASDLSLTLVDYAFSFSEPPTSGTHTIRVENDAPQAHEIAVFRFLPGKTMDDLMAWAETYDGPPPIQAAGGVPAIAPGQVVNMEVTFAPGDYVALCFVPDATDGIPHLVHGMALPFSVS